MADYRLLTGRTPNTNWTDEGIPRLLGIHFNVTEPGYDLTEISYLVPVQRLGELTTALVQLWNITLGVKIAQVDLKALPPADPETWMRATIPRHTPSLTDDYFVGYYTVGAPGHFTFNDTQIFPIISGPLRGTISGYNNGGGPNDPPNGTWTGFYLVDITASPAHITGTLAAGLSTIAPGMNAAGALSTPGVLGAVAEPASVAMSGNVFTTGAITGTLAATGPAPWTRFTDTPPAAPPGDPLGVLLAWLRAQPALTGYTFGTRRPAQLAGRLPYVQLTPTGGTGTAPTWRSGPSIGRPAVALQVWASPDSAAARIACGTVLSALTRLRNVTGAGLTIARAVPLSGLSDVPDAHAPDGIHRAAASIQLTTR